MRLTGAASKIPEVYWRAAMPTDLPIETSHRTTSTLFDDGAVFFILLLFVLACLNIGLIYFFPIFADSVAQLGLYWG